MNLFIAFFLILIGSLIIGLWTVFLIKREEIPELMQEIKETPYQIKLHIIAEYTTGIIAIFSGILILLGNSQLWILTPIALGMVLFASFQGLLGYAVEGEKPFVVILTIITCLSIIAIIIEIWMGFTGDVQSSTQLTETIWLWILVAIVLGIALYIVIQTIGYELHFGKGKIFGRHISLIFVLIFLLITIIMLILFLP